MLTRIYIEIEDNWAGFTAYGDDAKHSRIYLADSESLPDLLQKVKLHAEEHSIRFIEIDGGQIPDGTF